MNSMLDDDALTRLLAEAAESYPAPALTLPRTEPRRHRPRLLWGGVAAAAVVGLVVLGSVNGGVHPAVRSSAADRSAPPVTAPVPVPATANTDSSGKALVQGPLSTTARVPLAPFAGGSAGQAAGPQQDPGFADSAKIVKTGSIALIVKDGQVSSVVTRVTGIAQGAGGYVATSKSQEYGDDPSSTVTLRVPVDRFEAVVEAVRKQVAGGVGKVDSSSTSGQDVTAQYADVGAQIRSLTAARDRFLVLLGRANTIGQTLEVQQRVDDVQQQIDQLTGRQRVLKDQTSLGTLTVTVSEKPKAVATHEQSGLSKSWDNATHGFTSGIEALISKSGRALVVLLVLLVAAVVLRAGWRLARRRLV